MANKRADTVGDLVRHGIPLLVRCNACGHEGLFRAAEIETGRKNPYATRWETLRFRCTSCGSRRVKAGIQPFHMRGGSVAGAVRSIMTTEDPDRSGPIAQRCMICGGAIDLEEIARMLGWDHVTASMICARCAAIAGDAPEEEPPPVN